MLCCLQTCLYGIGLSNMAGSKFQYDESGGTFFYFLLSFLALVVIPCTYYFWPKDERKGKLFSKLIFFQSFVFISNACLMITCPLFPIHYSLFIDLFSSDLCICFITFAIKSINIFVDIFIQFIFVLFLIFISFNLWFCFFR